ncbi:hypothetical protein SAMN02982919_02291 [Giesbergeria anulus]|uniref:Transposase n=1 Tax=Giesbergeria anulus TaxID=180197 RepID=A0A1H9NQ48_9BURK|nr:hypothetical protein SAMN02982919_02291 [Giesbergeria anulus]
MSKSKKFSQKVREHTVRMVQEHRADYPSLWATIQSIALKIGCVPNTLHEWVKKADVNSGQRSGIITSDTHHINDHHLTYA